MRSMRIIISLSVLLLCFGSQTGAAQTRSEDDARPLTPSAQSELQVDDDEVIRVDTNLVTIPAIVMDREGHFVTNLNQKEFRVYEDGVEQQIAYFAPVERPFTVVLLLDTSPSTRFRLKDIQDAAISFIDQLRPEDRAVGVTFNSQLRVLNRMMRDREGLKRAIRNITPYPGTYLYATVDVMLNKLFRRIPGRKALVIFTDGVDNLRIPQNDTKRRATFASNIKDAEEADVLIYPIQYDTLEEVRQIARGGELEGLSRDYETAGNYLSELARKTGGRLYRADSVEVLKQAFAGIADELRRQYSLGYYPREAAGKGRVRNIKVSVSRPNLVVRARGSYVFNTPERKQP